MTRTLLWRRPKLFLSTLSLRRATWADTDYNLSDIISIHALLAESDVRCFSPAGCWRISIHALLAESDRTRTGPALRGPYFYPRSPCGERPPRLSRVVPTPIFLSTLSLRRATSQCRTLARGIYGFLSTLSLRRATERNHLFSRWICYFYPRSPCGERLFRVAVFEHSIVISIHALLAESDKRYAISCYLIR